MFGYWIVGAFFDDLETLTHAVGILRSCEALASCLAFAVGAVEVAPMVSLVCSYVVFGLAIPTTAWAVTLVPDHPVYIDKDRAEPAAENSDSH